MWYLDVRGRKISQDHRREQERSGRDRKFDFRSAEEAEGGSAKESESGHGGNNQKEEPKAADQGGDEAKKGKKAKTKTWLDVVKALKIS